MASIVFGLPPTHLVKQPLHTVETERSETEVDPDRLADQTWFEGPSRCEAFDKGETSPPGTGNRYVKWPSRALMLDQLLTVEPAP